MNQHLSMAMVAMSFEFLLSAALAATLAVISLFSLKLLIRPKSQSPSAITPSQSTVTPNPSPATVVVKGAASEKIQQQLIEQRHLGWSIGIAGDEEFDKNNHDIEDITTDEHEGAEIVQDCVRWLFRFTEAIQRGSTRTVRAWACFSPEGPFKLTEILYGSRRARKNHLRVHDTKNQIEPIGQINVDLLDQGIDPSQFRRRSNQLTGQEYIEMDYEVQVTFDSLGLEFQIIIPPKGEFPEEPRT